MKPSTGERVADVLLALVKSVCYLALFLGSQVLVMLPVIAVAAFQMVLKGENLDGSLPFQAIVEHSMTFSLIANLLTLVVILTFYLVRRKKFSEALWLRRVDAPALWEGVAFAPGLYLVVSLVLASLPESWLESYNEASAGITTGGAVGVLAVVVAAPVVEEIVFRGLIMTRLSQAMPGWLAVLVSAAIFGACHRHPVWFGYAFVLGSVFGFMDLRAGSIWPSILGHIVFNSFSQIITVLPETDEAEIMFMVVLLVLAVAAPIVDRVAARARRKAQAAPVQELHIQPGVYDFDPWDA